MKRFFAKHAKSSAFVLTLLVHGGLLITAFSIVAVTILIPKDPGFVDEIRIEHPRMPLQPRIKPFQPSKKRPPTQAPPRIQANIRPRQTVDFAIPQVAMIGIPMRGGGDDYAKAMPIGFNTDLDFFDLEADGEKVCFIVHFGPATIGKTPYSRMTGYTIRKRLAEIVDRLPDYTLFNVACFWANDTCAISPTMMDASKENKQRVLDWMEPVNPLTGDYDHCFVWQHAQARITAAQAQWPARVEGLPSYSPQWVYPYRVPKDLAETYLGEGRDFVHWGRAVAWSILTQQPDTIFVLTTNYIDGWGGGNGGEPNKMADGFEEMMRDVYGRDQKAWPTINVVVLSHAGRAVQHANRVLNEQFAPITRAFDGDGSVIEDIADYMNDEEQELLRQYASEYGH